MIWLYSGTPGSGKSFHALRDILQKVKQRKNNTVIANFPVDCGKYQDNFLYLDNSEITVDFLINYAVKNHKIGIENQTLVVIDEAGVKFNCRDGLQGSASKIRMEWLKFFSQHRKLGYNFILVAQSDRQLDKQIRLNIEYDVIHKKINNFFFFLPTTVFLAVNRWYGQKMKVGHEVIFFSKKIAAKYDSYKMFDTSIYNKIENNSCGAAACGGGEPPSGGGNPPQAAPSQLNEKMHQKSDYSDLIKGNRVVSSAT